MSAEAPRQGATVAAGGVVRRGAYVLLVRLTYSRQAGLYTLPGGYVEPDEVIDAAMEREVLEETGVTAAVQGLIGLRARVDDTGSNTYCLFLLEYGHGEARPNGREHDDARWFNRADLEGSEGVLVVGLARAAALAVLRDEVTVVGRQSAATWPGHDGQRWRVYL